MKGEKDSRLLQGMESVLPFVHVLGAFLHVWVSAYDLNKPNCVIYQSRTCLKHQFGYLEMKIHVIALLRGLPWIPYNY